MKDVLPFVVISAATSAAWHEMCRRVAPFTPDPAEVPDKTAEVIGEDLIISCRPLPSWMVLLRVGPEDWCWYACTVCCRQGPEHPAMYSPTMGRAICEDCAPSHPED